MFKGLDATVPARDVSRRINRGTRCYVFPSSKEPGVMHSFESREEYKRGLLLDLDPRVESFRDQPWTMDLETAEIRARRADFGKTQGRRGWYYTPDSECRMGQSAPRIIEVKGMHSDDEKYLRAGELLKQHGYEFLLLTGQKITDALIRNVSCLQRTRAEHFQHALPALLKELKNLATLHDAWAFEELAAANSFGIFGVYVGLANGIFSADLSVDLIPTNSIVRSAYGDLTHLHLGFL